MSKISAAALLQLADQLDRQKKPGGLIWGVGWPWISSTDIYIYMGDAINGGTPIAERFIMEHPLKMDDLGVPLFQETSICSMILDHLL